MKNKTLVSAFLDSAKSDGGIMFINGANEENWLSYADAYEQSVSVLGYLQQLGLQPGDEMVFQLDNNRSFIIVFWACLLGGIIPVPLSLGRNDDQKRKLINVWKTLHKPYLFTYEAQFSRITTFIWGENETTVYEQVNTRYCFDTIINEDHTPGIMHTPGVNDIAYIQFSSGSTGNPKGVVLTHKNLVTNVNAILKGIAAPATGDLFFSWMPLTHDMGLIGYHLTPMYMGWKHFIMPTELFIRRPTLWLQKISIHSITFTASPNFGYRYLLNALRNTEDGLYDLSCLRIITNGAEPISASLCQEFTTELARYGLKSNVIFPVYGLAEASLAVTFSQPEANMKVLHVSRDHVGMGDKVLLDQQDNTFACVNLGKPVWNCDVKITDVTGNALSDNTIGEILIKGGNVTAGYYNNTAATEKVITADAWLRTGDLGFVHEGCLFVTGRAKDIIFLNGQNFYPHDIENVIETIDGIDLGKVAVAGQSNHITQREELFVFVLFKGKVETFLPLLQQLTNRVNSTLGIEIDKVIPVREIPKTTSGKVQRYKLIELYNSGVFDTVVEEISAVVPKPSAAGMLNIEPQNNIQARLLEYWKKLLYGNQLSVGDNFFTLGGNSIKMASLVAYIQDAFGIKITFEEIYGCGNIFSLSELITKKEKHVLQAIPALQAQPHYVLSAAQRRIYYTWEADKNSTAYNIPFAITLDGPVDEVKLKNAISDIYASIDILRTTFIIENGLPLQVINPDAMLAFQMLETADEVTGSELKALVQPFDLHNGPLFRVVYLKCQSDKSVLFIDCHHIIADGSSIYILLEHIFKVYNGDVLSAPALHFRDYAAWENEHSSIYQDGTAFWQQRLGDELPVLNLPVDLQRTTSFNTAGKRLTFPVSQELFRALQAVAKQEKTTMFTLLLSAYKILLSKYAGQEDLLVGVPVIGRTQPQIKDLIGMFVNNLVVRSFPEAGKSYKAYLKELKQYILSALDNQEYPFEMLVDVTNRHRTLSNHLVFDTMFNYQNMELNIPDVQGVFIRKKDFDPGFSKFDLSFEIFEQADELAFSIEYATSLFREETMHGYAESFLKILHHIAENTDQLLADMSTHSAASINEILHQFNDTERAYSAQKTVVTLFEEMVNMQPDATAVEYNGVAWSYGYLQSRINQLAAVMQQHGVTGKQPVAIIMESDHDQVAALMAVIKAGGYYIPIDTSMPLSRISYILKDSQATVVISIKNWYDVHGAELGRGLSDHPPILLLDELPYEGTTVAEHIPQPADTAYVIYTSGTTGTPKGVAISNQSLVNYIYWAAKVYCKGEKLVFPLFTSVSFDLTVTSIFVPLLSGGRIIIYRDNAAGIAIEQVVNDNRVDVVKVTPSHLALLTDFLPVNNNSKISRFIVGGEELKVSLARLLSSKYHNKVEIFNEYGPTEATVGCMIHLFDLSKDTDVGVAIGKPIDNTQIYLLDKFLKPVGIRAIGEIYIGGHGLAKYYVGNEALTSEKFIPHPFIQGAKLYKTGDLGVWSHDGILMYKGRSDNQVKIKGFRIEPGEIEAQLLKSRLVKEAVVKVTGNGNNDGILCAYIVFENQYKETLSLQEFRKSALQELQDQLSAELPFYMIPRQYYFLERIPINNNGKVDVPALLALPVLPEQVAYAQAENNVQQRMIEVWQELLEQEHIGIYNNFFELGGDSIKAVQIVSRLSQYHINVNTKNILLGQTIAQISKQAELQPVNQFEQGILSGTRGFIPIESWFAGLSLAQPGIYNQTTLLKMHRRVDKMILTKVLNEILLRYDGLRQNFDLHRMLVNYNREALQQDLPVMTSAIATQAQLEQELSQLNTSFDLENDLLIRVFLITVADEVDYLYIMVHHLVIDGVSWRTLLADIHQLYLLFDNSLSPVAYQKTASARDWHQLLADSIDKSYINDQFEYWNDIVQNDFALPVQVAVTTWLHENYQEEELLFDAATTDEIIQHSKLFPNTDLQALLIAGLLEALNKWTGRTNITLELESHGRSFRQLDVSNAIGWFTVMYPQVFHYKCGDLGMQLQRIKRQIDHVPDNGIGFGILMFMKRAFADLNKISEVRFNYLGVFDRDLSNDLFTYVATTGRNNIGNKNHRTAKIDINCMIVNGSLRINVAYDQYAFLKTDIAIFLENYKNYLEEFSRSSINGNELHLPGIDLDLVDLDNEDLSKLFID
ncbi:non-ribosomal peptide synthetase [Chitinophaga sp. LS1]|uniref:non-ribosomal peptide synthetase n=1 Tax=Chitinophaga sp. LS1 TaxID=3051176 RepID=UPI002AAA93BE|nr:non-ribosomal peptide synthetase [Chitinophaga sp. LS1]WPV66530.1 amino acid adenylation domain-containing protein [Chitinophaga sp. LS1]